MLPEFRRQIFQLPLIATVWIYVRDRYVQERKTSSFPIRFTLAIIEHTLAIIQGNIIRPIIAPCSSFLNPWDPFLCSQVDTIRYVCPIVNQTKDEVIERYSDLFHLTFLSNSSFPSTSNGPPTSTLHNRRNRYLMKLVARSYQVLTHVLMMTEMYCRYVLNELNHHIEISRNLWKNLNMEDGRALEEVETYSEKSLVLGRRFIGNYRQLAYLIRYQFKRSRYLIMSLFRLQHRFRSFLFRLTRMSPLYALLSDFARYGWVTLQERVGHYLEALMLRAMNHPWIQWLTTLTEQSAPLQLTRPGKVMARPTFFVSSNNTSDCSGTEDNPRDSFPRMLQSTPYRRIYKPSPLARNKVQIEDALSDISSSSSDTLEQSLDVNDILRQVHCQSRHTTETNDSIDHDVENRAIERAFNEMDNQNSISQQPPVSVFDLSPMLASGCAV